MFTRKLSEFISRTNYKDLPPEVVTAAKMAILDFIGVAMAGSQEPSGRIINEMVKRNQSLAEATAIGGRFKASCSLAALANGSCGHVLDYDDCLDFPQVGLGHPSTGILPAALAVGETLHLSGQEVIAAYCLALEAYGKIGLLCRAAFTHTKGWEWTGVLGAMGATAAVTKLLILDENQIETGFGIAASLASGLTRNFGSMAGHLHAGNAARNGVEGGYLASQGYTAHNGIIEGPSGYYNTFTGDTNPPSEEAIREHINALGNPWNIVSPGLMFKAFPLAHISHFGVDAALQLKEKYVIDWQQIEEIEFHVPSVLGGAVSYREPQTGVEGKFSFGYCTSRVLIYGKIKISDFNDEAVKDPATRTLMKKIKWVVIPPTPEDGVFGHQEVIVKMKDGNVYRCSVTHPRGEPQNPLTREQHAGKYRDCALYAHYDDQMVDRIQEMILDLENVDDVSKLMVQIGR
jgi:2-methylcitrate dehydratase PrpD